AAHGAVVLRFDKAGSGKNPGPPAGQWRLDTYRDEARAALALLRTRPEVDRDQLFLAGNSEGGIHAIRVAEVEPVAGVIFLAAPARSMKDTMLRQIEDNLRIVGKMPADVVAKQMAALRRVLEDFVAGKPVDAAAVSVIPQ